MFFLEKMACNLCKNNDLFFKTVTEFENRKFLLVFLLNTILNINDHSHRFCYCKADNNNNNNNNNKCEICILAYIYRDQQFKIYENSLNIVFSKHSVHNLIKNLVILRNKKLHLVCNLINNFFFMNTQTGMMVKNVLILLFQQSNIMNNL